MTISTSSASPTSESKALALTSAQIVRARVLVTELGERFTHLGSRIETDPAKRYLWETISVHRRLDRIVSAQR